MLRARFPGQRRESPKRRDEDENEDEKEKLTGSQSARITPSNGRWRAFGQPPVKPGRGARGGTPPAPRNEKPGVTSTLGRPTAAVPSQPQTSPRMSAGKKDRPPAPKAVRRASHCDAETVDVDELPLPDEQHADLTSAPSTDIAAEHATLSRRAEPGEPGVLPASPSLGKRAVPTDASEKSRRTQADAFESSTTSLPRKPKVEVELERNASHRKLEGSGRTTAATRKAVEAVERQPAGASSQAEPELERSLSHRKLEATMRGPTSGTATASAHRGKTEVPDRVPIQGLGTPATSGAGTPAVARGKAADAIEKQSTASLSQELGAVREELLETRNMQRRLEERFDQLPGTKSGDTEPLRRELVLERQQRELEQRSMFERLESLTGDLARLEIQGRATVLSTERPERTEQDVLGETSSLAITRLEHVEAQLRSIQDRMSQPESGFESLWKHVGNFASDISRIQDDVRELEASMQRSMDETMQHRAYFERRSAEDRARAEARFALIDASSSKLEALQAKDQRQTRTALSSAEATLAQRIESVSEEQRQAHVNINSALSAHGIWQNTIQDQLARDRSSREKQAEDLQAFIKELKSAQAAGFGSPSLNGDTALEALEIRMNMRIEETCQEYLAPVSDLLKSTREELFGGGLRGAPPPTPSASEAPSEPSSVFAPTFGVSRGRIDRTTSPGAALYRPRLRGKSGSPSPDGRNRS